MSDEHGRPWTVPAGRWTMAQRWHDLLFMHWPVPVEVMQALVPATLPLDTYDGVAWIGVVPFWMSGVRPRFLPTVPTLSRFPELNVRTYVMLDGKPGVYFFSLDAANAVAVEVARRCFGLPYFRAEMSSHWNGECVEYASQRRDRGAPRASFRARYRPVGGLLSDVGSGTLAWWLIARYCLYVVGADGRLRRREIDHRNWPLQAAEVEVDVNTMTVPLGLALPDVEPLLHFSRRLDVVVWPEERV